MQFLNPIIKKAKAQRRNIVLAEGEDMRIIEAAARASQDGIANCILVGNAGVIRQKADESGFSLDDIRIEDPTSSQYHQRYSDCLFEIRRHKGLTLQEAQQQTYDPLCFADLMLRCDDADGAIAGALYTTGARVRSALQIIGVAEGFSTVSSFMLMLLEAEHHHPKRAMIFSDCALMIDPPADQLAEIALAAVQSARQFIDEEPRVALLSFSTEGSASHAMVDKVREATRLARELMPGIAIDGEVQLDAAIVASVAAQKITDSQTHGNANVLIFPDLNAGNIGYKIAQRFGDVTVIGPILQGLKRPANDLSRGCNAQDVYNLIALTAVQAQQN